MSGGVAVEITCTLDCQTLDELGFLIRGLAAPNDLPISIYRLEYQAVSLHDIAKCFRAGIDNPPVSTPHFGLLVIVVHKMAASSVSWISTGRLTLLHTITDANKS